MKRRLPIRQTVKMSRGRSTPTTAPQSSQFAPLRGTNTDGVKHPEAVPGKQRPPISLPL